MQGIDAGFNTNYRAENAMGEGRRESQTVKSDETLFAIVELLKEMDGAGVTEIAEELDLAKSSVHKHLASLRKHDYVVKENGVYQLGLQFFHYGEYTRNQSEMYHATQSKLAELAEKTGEMVWLITEENGRGMYLNGVKGNTEINVDAVIGSWTRLHYNSGGKAILAHLPSERRTQIIERRGLPARTANTITDPGELRDELETVRERGYALNLEEDLEGIHAVGVPLVFEGTVRGALSIAGAAHRMTRERCETEYADHLLAAANDIELNLVYQ